MRVNFCLRLYLLRTIYILCDIYIDIYIQILHTNITYTSHGAGTSTGASTSWLGRPRHPSSTCNAASASNRWTTLQFLRHPSTTRCRAWSRAVCPAVSRTVRSARSVSSSWITGTWHLTHRRGSVTTTAGKCGTAAGKAHCKVAAMRGVRPDRVRASRLAPLSASAATAALYPHLASL